MNKCFLVIVAIGLFAASLSAQQTAIWGKVRDTSGTPLEGVIVSLAAHPFIADTTSKDGAFALIGKVSGIRTLKADIINPFTRCIGNTVHFAVNEPTFVTIETFNTLGKNLSKPLNRLVSRGSYRIPLATDFGRQLLFVRISRGNDVKVFRMQNFNTPRKTTPAGFNGAFSGTSSLSKVSSGIAVDTLVFSRRGSLTQRMPITSFTPTDSIRMSLRVITDPFLFCFALNLTPMDTAATLHFRNDTAYLLSVIAFNSGGGNAYSSEVSVSSSDTDVVVSSSKSSLSNVQAGSVKTGTPVNFVMKKRLAAGRNVQLNFHFKDSWSGTTREWFDTLNWAPKPFLYEGTVLDDDNIAPTMGNGNGKVEPGEKIGLAPVIKNMSNGMIAPINGRILSTFSGLDTITKNNFFPWMNDTLASGKDGTADSEFVSAISSSMKIIYSVAPCFKDSIRYDVLVSGTYAKGNCQWILPVYCAAKIADTARILTITKVRCNVSISPNTTYYLTGDSVRLIATPNTGYHFVNWTGDTNTTISNIKLLMNSSKSLTATCALDSFPLRIHATNGTVTKNPDKPLYVYGDTVLLTAVPGTASRFYSWSGALTGSNNPAKLFITADSAVTANFSSPCTLTVNATNGTVTNTPDQPQYTNGDTVTLTAVPAFGRFLSWNGAVTGSINPTKLVMRANSTVIANFASPCTLTINAVNGTVTRDPDKLQYSYGDTVALTAVPASSSKFLSWGGAVTGNNNPAKLVVYANAIVTANFTAPCTLTVNGINGAVVKDPDKPQYAYGDTVTLTAVATWGHFLNWSGAMTGSTNPAKLIMTMNSIVTGNFTPPCTLLINATNGTVSKSPDKSQYANGDTIILTATPAASSRFLNWSGGITGSNNPAKMVITANSTVTANFSSPCTLSVNATNGTVSKNPDKPQYTSGDTVTLTAIPASGYHFFGWSGTVTGSANPAKLVIVRNSIITANFSLSITEVSAGSNYTMILKSDGTLWATGANDSGQLGDGTTIDKSTPTQIMTGVSTVSAGAYHTMILKSDGSLWATGSNRDGQLGDGTILGKITPVQIMTGVSAVSTGYWHTMILKSDGTLWATGANYAGQLGDGTTTNKSTAVQIMTGVKGVSAGGQHSMILKSDGTLWATGFNQEGQLGDGTYSNSKSTPEQIMTEVSRVSAGSAHTMILKTDGSLWATGDNQVGDLGDGTTTFKSTPHQVMIGVAGVWAGSYCTMIIKSDGTLWGTGSNSNGLLGAGLIGNQSTPIQIMAGVSAVSSGQGDHTMIIRSDGTLWATGKNQYGQLGEGTTNSGEYSPVLVQ